MPKLLNLLKAEFVVGCVVAERNAPIITTSIGVTHETQHAQLLGRAIE